jgi:hypothetical protein
MTSKLQAFDDLDPALAHLADPRFGPLLQDLRWRQAAAAELPEPCRTLLVHDQHMTAVLQAHYGLPVELHVLQEHQDADVYTRLIVLCLQGRSNEVVETGIMRLSLRLMTDGVRREILSRSAPLGDILIRHDVMRRIEPRWFLQLQGRSPLLEPFGRSVAPACGRIGIIHCDGQPAIELLEVVRAE